MDLLGKKEAKRIKKEIEEAKETATRVFLSIETAGPLVKRQLKKMVSEKDLAMMKVIHKYM